MNKQSLWADLKSFLFLLAFLGVFCIFAIPMGLGNALNTLMNTAYELLIGTVFKIMAIAVIAGAISNLLTEFFVHLRERNALEKAGASADPDI